MAIKIAFRTHIATMRVGEVRWTVPWAMIAKDGGYYINGEYQAYGQPNTGLHMKIMRTEDGFSVTLPQLSMNYIGQHFITSGLYFPVVEIHQYEEH